MSDVRIGATNSIMAIDTWLKALAGNLTGSTVTGYRQTRVQFTDVLVEQLRAPAPATTQPKFPDIAPIQFGTSGIEVKSTRTDFSQGALNGTQRPSDLAITGNGFFILSKVPNPTKLTDLVFTRNGSFTFELEPDASLLSREDQAKLGRNSQVGRLNLVSAEGYYVMGVTGSWDNAGLPEGIPGVKIPPIDAATQGNSITNLANEPARGNGAGVPDGDPGVGGLGLKPFSYPFVKDSAGNYNLNDDLLGQFSFNRNGMLQNNLTQDVPYSTADYEFDGRIVLQGGTNNTVGQIANQIHYNKYVGLATMASPDGLLRQGGTEFIWAPTAGPAFIGVAGTGLGPVGSSNEISAGALETSNSSVNTALPELTIAQKSFTANVKIVSVGNTLIDDVNQLIR